MITLIDNQHELVDKHFETREEVYQHLLNYHAPDLQKGVVYELEDLLDIGGWDILIGSEDYDMLARENAEFAKAFKKLGYTDEQISDIANGAI